MDAALTNLSLPRIEWDANPKGSEAELLDIPPVEIFEGPQVNEFTESEAVVPTKEVADGKMSWPQKTWEAVKNHKALTAAGAIAVASLAANPIGDTLETVKDLGPYGAGMLATEAVWIGGAAIMLATGGKKMLNPLKIKSAFKDIGDNARDSKLFKAGFALNLGAAAAQFAVPTVAVTANMPPHTWGVLAVGAIDLWATIALRQAIWKGVHKKDQTP